MDKPNEQSTLVFDAMIDEAILAGRLDHENVCKLYSVTETEKHYVFELEYIKGVELAEMVIGQDGHLSDEQ